MNRLQATVLTIATLLIIALVPGTAGAIPQGGCCATVLGACLTTCNKEQGCTGEADCDVVESKGTLEQLSAALASFKPGEGQQVRRRLALDLGYRVEGLEPVPLKLKRRSGGSPGHSAADDFLGRCPEGTVATPFEMPIYDQGGNFVVGFETVWFCIDEDLEPAG